MRPTFVHRTTMTTVAGCLALLVIALTGAWFVRGIHRLQSVTLARHVTNVVAAEELEIEMREIRNRINRFLRTGTISYLDEIPEIRTKTTELLQRARARAETPEEAGLATRLAQGYDQFFVRFQELHAQLPSEAARKGLSDLIDNQMAKEIFAPARAIVTLHQREMLDDAQNNQQMANRMGVELVLLGACGAVAGALGGYGLARSLQGLLIELSVPIHGVAGQLDEVIGPLKINAHEGSASLEQTLREIESRVGYVVDHLQQTRREVQRAEQLALAGQLATGVAHELRNALMPVKLLVDSAVADQRQLPPDELGVVSREIGRLETAVNRLLDYARPVPPEKRLFDLRDLANETEQLVAGRALAQQVEMRTDLPQNPLLVDADKEQLRQVLLNLLLNALDAMPTGGQLSVTVRAVDHPAPHGEADGAVPMVQLTVADTGSGLPPSVASRLFQPFVTSRSTGTGLGLSICKRIVEAHGGAIALRNLPEGGAQAEVCLVACPAPVLSSCPV